MGLGLTTVDCANWHLGVPHAMAVARDGLSRLDLADDYEFEFLGALATHLLI